MSARPKKINTPFGYFGSKNKIASQLCRKLPPHNCWVEVFCGSAALTLNKSPARIEIINDIDGEVTNLFQQLRRNPEKLYRQIFLTPYSEDELAEARRVLTRRTKLERARIFLVQSMMAVNGTFGKDYGGFSYSDSYSRNGKEARVSRWWNLPKRLAPVVDRLRNVRIENKDARTVIKRFLNRPATLLYLDPPYLTDRSEGYSFDAKTKGFHAEILRLANKAKCMVFISGYENDLYNLHLTEKRGWKKKEIRATIRGIDGKSHKRTEVIWMNKHFVANLNAKTPLFKLSKRETKMHKVNPTRS